MNHACPGCLSSIKIIINKKDNYTYESKQNYWDNLSDHCAIVLCMNVPIMYDQMP